MWQFDGLPLHPLVVHAPVVLIPLVATGLVLVLVRPASRRVLVPVLAALALGAAVTAVLATETGEQLAEALDRGDTVEVHEERGELVRLAAVALAVGAVGLAGIDRWAADGRLGRSRLPTAVVALVGAGATVAVGLAGHSGATLAWEDKIAAATGATAPGGGDGTEPEAAGSATPAPATPTTTPSSAAASPTGPDPSPAPASPGTVEELVDVVLGEWTIVMSVEEAPPGPTTFRVRNAGTRTHAFRIRTPGSGGDRQEWRSEAIAPGEELEVTWDLPAGQLEVDCPVEDDAGEHDALGMETVLVVRAGAPPVTSAAPPATAPSAAPTPARSPAPTDGPAGDAPASPAPPGSAAATPVAIDIQAFAFAPDDVSVPVGTEVTWTNRDPTSHTATGDAFDTGSLAAGDTGSTTFDQPGEFAYLCAIHPSMTGRVVVEP